MQGAGFPPQQRRQEPVELSRHATERPRRNPKASKAPASDPSRQNPPDRPGSQHL